MSSNNGPSAGWPKPALPKPTLRAILLNIPLTAIRSAKPLFNFVCTSLLRPIMMRSSTRSKSDLHRHITTSISKHTTSIQIEDKICPICHEPIGVRNTEGVKEGWSMLPCGHTFGSYCIKHYLSVAADDQPLCPVCRHVAYHDLCGHPVLPFVLKANGTHPELVVDTSSGKVRPPTGEEDLAKACDYCRGQGEGEGETKKQGRYAKLVEHLGSVRHSFRWMKVLLPYPLRRTTRDELLSGEISDDDDGASAGAADRHLTRQEARTRRRTRVTNQADWDGPWMDVQTRDVRWENWWKEQAPRGA